MRRATGVIYFAQNEESEGHYLFSRRQAEHRPTHPQSYLTPSDDLHAHSLHRGLIIDDSPTRIETLILPSRNLPPPTPLRALCSSSPLSCSCRSSNTHPEFKPTTDSAIGSHLGRNRGQSIRGCRRHHLVLVWLHPAHPHRAHARPVDEDRDPPPHQHERRR